MTADEDGNVYIADAENSLIRKISINGNVTTVAGDGFIGDQETIPSPARTTVTAEVYVYSPFNVSIKFDKQVEGY